MADTFPLYLPDDLVLEILSRLPIESIIRFRSICKLWKDIIQDPYFISLQLRNFNTKPSRLLVTISAILGSHANCFLFDNIASKTKMLFSCHLDNPEFMCSYHGLVCIAPRYHLNPLLICNPITREYLILPTSNFRGLVRCHRVALGYDDSTKRYKVVRSYKRIGVDYFNSGIELLTLGERVWKELPTRESFVYENQGPVFCDGAFYWISGHSHHYFLLLLDISSEKFFIAPERFYFPTSDLNIFTRLLNHEGSLILAFYDGETFALWMFRLKGKEAGSTYVMQLSNILNEDGIFYVNMGLVSMLSHGAFLSRVIALASDLSCSYKVLMYYHPEFGALASYNINVPQSFNFMEFKPSLVSPRMVASSERA